MGAALEESSRDHLVEQGVHHVRGADSGDRCWEEQLVRGDRAAGARQVVDEHEEALAVERREPPGRQVHGRAPVGGGMSCPGPATRDWGWVVGPRAEPRPVFFGSRLVADRGPLRHGGGGAWGGRSRGRRAAGAAGGITIRRGPPPRRRPRARLGGRRRHQPCSLLVTTAGRPATTGGVGAVMWRGRSASRACVDRALRPSSGGLEMRGRRVGRAPGRALC